MQIVIDIDEELYKTAKEGILLAVQCSYMMDAIRNGTPLLKGHEYIDRNNAITSICQYYTTCERMKMLSFTPNLIKQEVADILMKEPTIEADREVDHD